MNIKTSLWATTLGAQGDSDDEHRERLRQAYSTFRERVGQLIQTIPRDIPGLTVHDLSHMDALWEMADLLTGGNYALNPAEAFVFGGAILLHDSALTVCAYEGGAKEVQQTPQYSDALAQLRSNLPTKLTEKTTNLPQFAEMIAMGEALRITHAKKAEELSSQKWTSPISSEPQYLIDDSDLRDHYSHSIGRIAHSHHWDISEIPKSLNVTLGAFSGFPSAWTVDQVKVALLLRCVDAMQIDDRRAPNFLASIREIGSGSIEHWKFQNKIAIPHLEDGKLVYTSKSPFGINEAAAWNLCFDTLQLIDRELRDTNDLHLQKSLPTFQAFGVAGASAADALSQYVQVEGWKPLPLNLKVSNVPNLARTLGGRDLYNNPLTPLRELIQNAADAIEARTLVDNDFSYDDALITIKFTESESGTILEIEDNGIGMSERVLTTALLDFGFSFWKSSAARDEFPGIQSEVNRFRGRYGIGFFSVFMWSGEVAVTSRRFNEGNEGVRILEFHKGIESRPILRAASENEKSSKWTTRIRLNLERDFLKTVVGPPETQHSPEYYRQRYVHRHPIGKMSLLQSIRLLCGVLPVKVTLELNNRKEKVSLPNWRECSANDFLDFFSGVVFNRNSSTERFIDTLTSLSQEPPLGGRCYLSPYNHDGSRVAVYEKGIFVSFSRIPNIQGVVEGVATNAARDQFSAVSVTSDSDWIKEVRSKAFALCQHDGERISLQEILLSIDEPDANQPLFIRNRELITFSKLSLQIKRDGIFSIRLTEDSDNVFKWERTEKLSSLLGLDIDERRVYSLVEFRGVMSPDSNLAELIESKNEPLFLLLRKICDVLGSSPEIHSEYHQMSGYRESYIDVEISAIPSD